MIEDAILDFASDFLQVEVHFSNILPVGSAVRLAFRCNMATAGLQLEAVHSPLHRSVLQKQ